MDASAVGLLSLLLLTASASLPKFAVPNFPDLKIKTRWTVDDRRQTEETLYLKGPRQRSEHVLIGARGSVKSISITQCDQKLTLDLNDGEKLYSSSEIQDWVELIKRARRTPQAEMSGAEVIVTVDSVDTGERRQFGSYEARHVKTTTKVEPGPGAVIQSSITQEDGWYIDLPGLGCQESRGAGVGLSALIPGGQPMKRDRLVMKRLGTARRGHALEGTTRKTEGDRTTVSKLDLLEFSDLPLDASLFELPAGYRPALRTPHGGRDMTKPDTLSNRLQAYWELWTASARHWFRSLG
jgi:hypothetical protein